MASGAITPGAAASPVQPIVNTRKNVPMNSTAYRCMARPLVLDVEPSRSWITVALCGSVYVYEAIRVIHPYAELGTVRGPGGAPAISARTRAWRPHRLQ